MFVKDLITFLNQNYTDFDIVAADIISINDLKDYCGDDLDPIKVLEHLQERLDDSNNHIIDLIENTCDKLRWSGETK